MFKTDTSEVVTGSSNGGKGVTDASNTPSHLPSKVVSSSTRPTTSTNDKENLPTIDKSHRPITAVVPSTIVDHSLINGIPSTTTTTTSVNPVQTNPILTSSSVDTSTTGHAQHSLLKTSTSGGPPVSSISTSVNTRTNPVDKPRAQTVRLPGTGVRRRETIDPVPGGMRKVDEKNKVTGGET